MKAFARTVLIPLAFCLFSAFSLPCSLDIDGHGNMGDETMTVALGAKISLSSLPEYGYRPDGQPWTWGVNTAALYAWFYGPAVQAAPTFRRIEAARLVSHALGGLALYLLTLSLLQLVFQRTPGKIPLWAHLLAASFIALVFMNSPRFRFISSFARVEALGFFFLAAALAMAPRLLATPRRLTVFLFTLLALSTSWASYIAFYLVAFIGAFSWFALLVLQTRRGSLRERTVRTLSVAIAPVGMALLVFAGISFGLNSGLSSGPSQSFLGEMFSNLTSSILTANQEAALARPERWWFVGASVAGLLCVAARAFVLRRAGRSGADAPARLSDLAWVALASVGLFAVYRLWFMTLGSLSIRFTYDVMITTAFAFLQLLVFCFVLRDRRVERYIMIAATLAALMYVSVYPRANRSFICREDAALVDARIWPRRAVVSGIFNPFNESADEPNRARRLHISAARDYLRANGVQHAMATDPMFATMSDSTFQFYFINDSYVHTTPSPSAEEQMVQGFIQRDGIRYIVSTNFGESEPFEMAGFAAMRRCLRSVGAANGASAVCQFGPQTIEVTRVFRTDAVVTDRTVYTYANENSTPISVFSITLPK